MFGVSINDHDCLLGYKNGFQSEEEAIRWAISNWDEKISINIDKDGVGYGHYSVDSEGQIWEDTGWGWQKVDERLFPQDPEIHKSKTTYYVVRIDTKGSGKYSEKFRTKNEAIAFAKNLWTHLTKHNQEKYVIEVRKYDKECSRYDVVNWKI